ncbi:MAG: hypothetical protein EAZ97_03820 [Bacteroidetes bacterium]|nr:MAG: hypothetical protein EAZ97_03820 [Bacteroidota bacterium]
MLKLPSLVKLPKYKSFSYQPRYYNPEEEERKQRKAEMEKTLNETEAENLIRERRISKIKGAFARNKAKKGTDFSQLLFVVFSLFFVYLYMEFGNYAFIFLTGFLGWYVWHKKTRG